MPSVSNILAVAKQCPAYAAPYGVTVVADSRNPETIYVGIGNTVKASPADLSSVADDAVIGVPLQPGASYTFDPVELPNRDLSDIWVIGTVGPSRLICKAIGA